MKQTARELTSAGDGFLEGKQYLIMDRDTKFSAAFRDVLAQVDVESVVLPPRSPNLNAHMERFFGSLKAECLDRLTFFGEGMLRRTVREYVQHYHEERNHQGLDNTILVPGEEVGSTTGPIKCRERLGCAALLPSSGSLTARDWQFFQPRRADPPGTRSDFIGFVISVGAPDLPFSAEIQP